MFESHFCRGAISFLFTVSSFPPILTILVKGIELDKFSGCYLSTHWVNRLNMTLTDTSLWSDQFHHNHRLQCCNLIFPKNANLVRWTLSGCDEQQGLTRWNSSHKIWTKTPKNHESNIILKAIQKVRKPLKPFKKNLLKVSWTLCTGASL